MRLIALAAAAALVSACGDGPAAVAGPKAQVRTAVGAMPAERASGQQKFRDWLAVCDNVGTCHAFGPASEGTGWVRISLPAGPAATPGVLFGFWSDDGVFEGPSSLKVDGATFPARAETGADAPPVAAVSPDVARALVDAMAQGTAMTATVGAHSVPISLTGTAAALLWIDERQGRLGTTTALVRRGARPASTVPTAPAAPRIEAAPAVAQTGYGDQAGQTLPAAVEALPDVARCRAETAFNPDLQTVISSARLDADTVLWSVPCGLGAYNFANAYFTTTPQGTNPRRLTFPGVSGRPHDLLVNASYDPATRVIDAFNKGRGLGDCGMADRWTWTRQGFVLKSSSEMSECWGVPAEYWPASWVSE